jgi:glycosyltransferase involved in cell wall biosynthesis
MFLKAAALTLQEAPRTYFVLAGDGPERRKLEHLARELGIVDRVRFLGVVANVPAILKTVDVSVLSSVHEALPLTLLEAMAAARPVVTTDVGSVCEIVEDGVNGFVVPSGATEQFAQAILRLLRDPELARRFGQAGRHKVEQKFAVERMVRRCEALFAEWVASSGPSPTTVAEHSRGSRPNTV